jgi:hypothetical protein
VDYFQFFKIYGNAFRDECRHIRTDEGKECLICYEYEGPIILYKSMIEGTILAAGPLWHYSVPKSPFAR